jgi:hypothetical protein
MKNVLLSYNHKSSKIELCWDIDCCFLDSSRFLCVDQKYKITKIYGRHIHFSNGNGSFPFYADMFFLYHQEDFYRNRIWVTWRVSYKKYELLTLPVHLSSCRYFGGVHVPRRYFGGACVPRRFSLLCCGSCFAHLCFVFVLCLMLHVSLDCPFLPHWFSLIYIYIYMYIKNYNITWSFPLRYPSSFSDRRGRDRMIVSWIYNYLSVTITTYVVNLNAAQARYTQYNIMW